MDQYTIITLIVLLLLSVFQISLIFGAPLGNFAWGGKYKTLPIKLRIGSVSSIVIYAIFALFILEKSNTISIIKNIDIINTGLWVIFYYSLIGIFMNAISRSKPERYTMTPVALTMAICLFFIVTK